MVGGKEQNFKKIKNQDQLKKIIDYFIKYIQKSIFDNQFPGKKKYITSKGLLKPQEQYFEKVIDLIYSEIPSECLVYKRDGETEYKNSDINDTVGQPKNYLRWLNYWQYDPSKNPHAEDRINKILET